MPISGGVFARVRAHRKTLKARAAIRKSVSHMDAMGFEKIHLGRFCFHACVTRARLTEMRSVTSNHSLHAGLAGCDAYSNIMELTEQTSKLKKNWPAKPQALK